MDGFEIDASDLKDFSRELRRASLEVREEIDKTLVVVGKEIEEAAKHLASEHSKTIAGTIRMRAVPGAVVIEAGNADTPIAALYELGNKKGRRTAKTFRHPVWGSDVWVEQPRYRFLAPALAADRRHITSQMEVAWDRAMRKAGLERF